MKRGTEGRLLFLDIKLELIFAMIFIMGFVLKRVLNIHLPFSLTEYLTKDRLNGIAAFFAITIGVYIAVITVFATSQLGISKEMLKRKLDIRLINVMAFGMFENIVTAGMAVFVPQNRFTRYWLVVMAILAIVSFGKFLILMVRIFKVNMDQMAIEIDQEDNYKNVMETYIKLIEKHLQEEEKEDILR